MTHEEIIAMAREEGLSFVPDTNSPLARIVRKAVAKEREACAQVCDAERQDFFLSCLCGSEPGPAPSRQTRAFLSCLCGSEPGAAPGLAMRDFLSCLCGSEQQLRRQRARWPFLSCLCGSER